MTCLHNDWTNWSKDCGMDMKRIRTVKTQHLTKQLVSCDGLLQSCSAVKEQIQQTSKKCKKTKIDQSKSFFSV